jgi:hypothetical protein
MHRAHADALSVNDVRLVRRAPTRATPLSDSAWWVPA